MHTKRNRTIDVFKGILILVVLILHYPVDRSGIAMKAIYAFGLEFAVPCFMFLSGYVQAKSMCRHEIRTFEAAYACPLITGKLLRFLLPYVFFFIASQVFFRVSGMYTVGIVEYGLLALFFEFLTGGHGPGSYYVPLLFQLIFLFPVVYAIIAKKGKRGLGILFAGNLLFEVLKQAFSMNEVEYRLLIFRYLFLIACGCYAAVREDTPSAPKQDLQNASRQWQQDRFPTPLHLGISFLVGVAFILLFCYTGYAQRAKIFTMWSNTCVLTALYVIPILWLLVRKVHFSFAPLELLGKYSFHIFLVQTVYYQYYDFALKDRFSKGTGFAVTILTCVALGVVFGFVEERIRLREKILFVLFERKKKKESE